jgi:hypothetical protein
MSGLLNIELRLSSNSQRGDVAALQIKQILLDDPIDLTIHRSDKKNIFPRLLGATHATDYP